MTRDEIEIQSANDTGCEVMCGIYIRSFPEIGVPLVIIHFNRISFINHPIWGTPIHLLPILKHHPDTLGSPPRTEIRARGNRQVHACRERSVNGEPTASPPCFPWMERRLRFLATFRSFLECRKISGNSVWMMVHSASRYHSLVIFIQSIAALKIRFC